MNNTTKTQLITSEADLKSLVGRLSGEARLAFDTEAASFHRFVDRVYLIQVSSERENAIVDPLAVADLSPIGTLLSNPAIEVIFHDADYDLRSLDRDYAFRAHRIFDTRIAAQLLGEPGVGLSALLQKYFAVTLNKKLQRADWSVRPLTQDMIDYAGADTAHLPALRDLLEAELKNRGRLEWALEEFARLEAVRWTGSEPDPEAYLRLKGAKALPRPQQLVLRSLCGWRDDRARSLDRAPFRVLQNETLVAIAQKSPADLASLRTIPGVPQSTVERHGAELLQVVTEALNSPDVTGPKKERVYRPRPDAETEIRFERLKQMRNERARELGLEPGVLCANGALQTLAWSSAQKAAQPGEGLGGPEMRNWQRLALGEERIYAALSGSTMQR